VQPVKSHAVVVVLELVVSMTVAVVKARSVVEVMVAGVDVFVVVCGRVTVSLKGSLLLLISNPGIVIVVVGPLQIHASRQPSVVTLTNKAYFSPPFAHCCRQSFRDAACIGQGRHEQARPHSLVPSGGQANDRNTWPAAAHLPRQSVEEAAVIAHNVVVVVVAMVVVENGVGKLVAVVGVLGLMVVLEGLAVEEPTIAPETLLVTSAMPVASLVEATGVEVNFAVVNGVQAPSLPQIESHGAATPSQQEHLSAMLLDAVMYVVVVVLTVGLHFLGQIPSMEMKLCVQVLHGAHTRSDVQK